MRIGSGERPAGRRGGRAKAAVSDRDPDEKLPANESGRRRLPVTQLRDADGSGKKDAVKDIDLIIHKGTAESEPFNVRQSAHEVVEGVAKASRGKYGADEAEPEILF